MGVTTRNNIERPRVRFSLRWKIPLPFMLLALMLGRGATYLVSAYLATSAQERFLRQLSDSGQQAIDGIVRTENELLGVERLVANTDGGFEAGRHGDARVGRKWADRCLPDGRPDFHHDRANPGGSPGRPVRR